MFVGGADGDWIELTAGAPPAVRLSAADLQQAQRASARLRDGTGTDAASVILDVTVLVADDVRSAIRRMSALGVDDGASLHYAGTLDGLAGLVADIFVTGVADGVTLLPAVPQQDLKAVGEAVLARIAERVPIAA